MSTDMMWQMVSTSSDETESFGASLGAKLRGGEVLELVSDLGGGKTTLTRGIARGAGSTVRVASPTFTISKEYNAPKFTIVHFDFYRLGEAGIVGDEFAEYIGDPAYVIIVEWGDVVQNVLPPNHLTITIKQTVEGNRDIACTYNKSLRYLLEEVK